MADKVVEVPGLGVVSFPSDMGDDQIADVIRVQTRPGPAKPPLAFGLNPGEIHPATESALQGGARMGYEAKYGMPAPENMGSGIPGLGMESVVPGAILGLSTTPGAYAAGTAAGVGTHHAAKALGSPEWLADALGMGAGAAVGGGLSGGSTSVGDRIQLLLNPRKAILNMINQQPETELPSFGPGVPPNPAKMPPRIPNAPIELPSFGPGRAPNPATMPARIPNAPVETPQFGPGVPPKPAAMPPRAPKIEQGVPQVKPVQEEVMPEMASEAQRADMNRQIHALAQEKALPGSPAGSNTGAHDYLKDYAVKKYGVKSWADMEYPQMLEMYEQLRKTGKLK